MKLIAGLGNPESRYANTRHNVGFDAAEIARQKAGFGVEKLRFHACISSGTVGGEQIIIARPQTYMNLSGVAIREIAAFYKIAPEDILILCDDVSIPFGARRIRADGSAGGHNGLKNIIAQLGTEGFARIRIGVGEKPADWDLADYVLAKFTPEEVAAMRENCEKVAEAALCWATDGLAPAMNRYNYDPEREKKLAAKRAAREAKKAEEAARKAAEEAEKAAQAAEESPASENEEH